MTHLRIVFPLPAIVLFCIQACDEPEARMPGKPLAYSEIEYLPPPAAKNEKPAISIYAYNNTKGIREDGRIIARFDCPDSRFFPPIDIRNWDKTPAVNGRLPTYEETQNGTAISHYGETPNSYIQPYGMFLPKLAYHRNPTTKLSELVVVIQIVKTPQDTVVGYRYLSGGCGGERFHKFYFLNDETAREAVRQYCEIHPTY